MGHRSGVSRGDGLGIELAVGGKECVVTAEG